LFWGTAAAVIVVDFITKLLAEHFLVPRYVPHRVIGEVVRFTLAYNPGAAFSMSLGEYSPSSSSAGSPSSLCSCCGGCTG
jgi:lipoprotein signal peptidase